MNIFGEFEFEIEFESNEAEFFIKNRILNIFPPKHKVRRTKRGFNYPKIKFYSNSKPFTNWSARLFISD